MSITLEEVAYIAHREVDERSEPGSYGDAAVEASEGYLRERGLADPEVLRDAGPVALPSFVLGAIFERERAKAAAAEGVPDPVPDEQPAVVSEPPPEHRVAR